MNVIVNIVLLISSFLFMEAVAWFTHKYVMHGFLWTWHRDHHQHSEGFFERNDYFAVVFSIPSMLCIYLGFQSPDLSFLKWIGFGILGYGIFYVIFHDIIVHRRVKIRFIAKSLYMKRMIRAHKIHHKYSEKYGAEAFGFLYAPKKYEPKTEDEKLNIINN